VHPRLGTFAWGVHDGVQQRLPGPPIPSGRTGDRDLLHASKGGDPREGGCRSFHRGFRHVPTLQARVGRGRSTAILHAVQQ
jgi:hypothetical protein